MEQGHRHYGVYGICLLDSKLLVIHKHGGPYTGRYDLPGGTMEDNESLQTSITREFMEETGIQISVVKNIGTTDFLIPYTRTGFDHTHCHHIANIYETQYISGDPTQSPKIDDSRGAEFIEIDRLHIENASPLVMAAVSWIESRQLDCQLKVFPEWEIKLSKGEEDL